MYWESLKTVWWQFCQEEEEIDDYRYLSQVSKNNVQNSTHQPEEMNSWNHIIPIFSDVKTVNIAVTDNVLTELEGDFWQFTIC